MARLPTFLVIGAMKAGTTSLYGHLTSHPDIYLPRIKEPDFFIQEKAWGRGLDWYRSLFVGAGAARAIGEASTSYSKCTEFAGVPARIAGVIPDVRLIYLVRDPVARIRSMYLHCVIRGGERRPVEQAVLEDPKYVGASCYGQQLRAYLPYFPLEQLLIVTTEELQADADGVLERVHAFVGVDPQRAAVDPCRRAYRTSERRADSRVRATLRRTPGWEAAARAVPAPLASRLKLIGTHQLDPATAEVSPMVEAALRERLCADMDDFRSLTQVDTTAWGW